MRMPRVRLTVRTMMVVVAISAAVCAAIVGLKERSERFGWIAVGYEMEADNMISALELFLLLSRAEGETGQEYAARVHAARPIHEFYQYLGQMAGKYYQASCRPWLPVGFESPPPKPSREYVKAIIDRYIKIPGRPDPPRPPHKSPEEYRKAMIDSYNHPKSIQSL